MARLITGAFIKDRIYIPRGKLKLSRVKKHYEYRMFKESVCQKCEVFKNGERFNDICATCPAYMGVFQMWGKKNINGTDYITLHKGYKEQVEKRLNIDLSKIKDKRASPKMFHKLKLTKKLFKDQKEKVEGGYIKRVNQLRLIKGWLKNPEGVILAPARSGKTVIGAACIRALRVKTLVVAHESTLLDQFYETIYSFTNAKKLERKSKRKVAVLIKSMDDFNIPADIYLTTYQKFIQPKTSKKRIKKYLKGKFGLVIFDETHLCAAPAFSKFAAGLDSKYVLGLTATYERKDGHEKVVEAIIGPVRIEGKSVGMKPVVEIHDTKLGPKYEWKGMQAYTKAVTWTANNKERNKQIVKRVFADLRANKKHNIIIPIERRNQARLLVEMINRQAEYNRDNKGEKWAVRLAREYIGGVDKKKVLSYMKEGKGTRVLVAMRKMCKLGLNLEPLTHMHLQIPINNAPDFYQLTQRICTFYPGKPQPKLIMYVDNIGISRGCFTASWWNGVVKLKYKYSQATAEQAKLISSANRPNLRSDYFARRYVGGGGQRRSTGPTIHKASWGV